MTSSTLSSRRRVTHLALAVLASISIAANTNAEPYTPDIPRYGTMLHAANYEGHGLPHHAKGHSGHASPPHGGGHFGSYGGGSNAHGPTHPGPHQSASEFIDHVLKFKDGMGITDQQETELRTLETNFKKTKIKLKAESDLANLELHDLLRDDKASMTSIESKLKKVHEIKANLYLESIKVRREAKAVLSDEQRSRMETIHERIKSHGSKMKGYSRDTPPHGDMSKHGG